MNISNAIFACAARAGEYFILLGAPNRRKYYRYETARAARAMGLQVVRITRRLALDDAEHIQVSCCRDGCGSVLRARICERTESMGEIVQEQVKRATTEIILADIIDFSLLSAEKQYAAVRNMTGLLDSRLRLMSGLAFWRLDEIVLSFVPTGDGFYILLQPLAAGYGLFLAISLRSSILTGMEPPDLLKGVRFAVHVGECFAFRDITGKENWIGPGLNECARLISAKPEQSPNEGIPADQSFIIVSEREYAYFRQRFRETPGMARFLDSLKVKLSDEFDFVDKHGIKHTARFVESSRHVAVNPPAPPDLEERRRKFVEEQIQKQGR